MFTFSYVDSNTDYINVKVTLEFKRNTKGMQLMTAGGCLSKAALS